MTLKLRAKTIKATIVLDPTELAGVVVPNGQSRFPVAIVVAGKVLWAELNAKSLRRCVTTIAEAGPDAVSIIIQGKLVGDVIEEAGIAANPKQPKPQGEASEAQAPQAPAVQAAAQADPAEIRRWLGLASA
jgi:hypothetical protein